MSPVVISLTIYVNSQPRYVIVTIYQYFTFGDGHSCHNGLRAVHLGQAVRKPVNANLGLKFNQDPCFSYLKRVFTVNTKWPFESNQSHNVGQKRLQESASFGYKRNQKLTLILGPDSQKSCCTTCNGNRLCWPRQLFFCVAGQHRTERYKTSAGRAHYPASTACSITVKERKK